MAVVQHSRDVLGVRLKLADEKCARMYIFHHNIANKLKENLSKLKFLEVPFSNNNTLSFNKHREINQKLYI